MCTDFFITYVFRSILGEVLDMSGLPYCGISVHKPYCGITVRCQCTSSPFRIRSGQSWRLRLSCRKRVLHVFEFSFEKSLRSMSRPAGKTILQHKTPSGMDMKCSGHDDLRGYDDFYFLRPAELGHAFQFRNGYLLGA